jgi:hypothetical protein
VVLWATVITTAILGFSGTAPAGNVLLRWLPSPGASGYRLYVGTQSRRYTEHMDLGLLSASTVGGIVYHLVSGLAGVGPYYFTLTASNAAGESDYSNEKSVAVDSGNAPRADAGSDRTGGIHQTFALGSAAAPGVSYIWLQLAGPPVPLNDQTNSRILFAPYQPGAFEFMLIAYDDTGRASADTVSVFVQASTPARPASTPPLDPTATPSAAPTSPFAFTITRTVTATAWAPPTPTPTLMMAEAPDLGGSVASGAAGGCAIGEKSRPAGLLPFGALVVCVVRARQRGQSRKHESTKTRKRDF